LDRIYRINRIKASKLLTQSAQRRRLRRSHRGSQRKPPIPSPKLFRFLLLGIKVHFYPGTQNLTADFGEIPLPAGEVDEGIERFLAHYSAKPCVLVLKLCDLCVKAFISDPVKNILLPTGFLCGPL